MAVIGWFECKSLSDWVRHLVIVTCTGKSRIFRGQPVSLRGSNPDYSGRSASRVKGEHQLTKGYSGRYPHLKLCQTLSQTNLTIHIFMPTQTLFLTKGNPKLKMNTDCYSPKAITAASRYLQSACRMLPLTKGSTWGTTSSSQHVAINIKQTPAALHGFHSSSSSYSSCHQGNPSSSCTSLLTTLATFSGCTSAVFMQAYYCGTNCHVIFSLPFFFIMIADNNEKCSKNIISE